MTRWRSCRVVSHNLNSEVVALAAGLAVFCAFACWSSTVSAQNGTRSTTKFYTDFSDTADALLRNAASHSRDGQWPEAVEIYQRVIQQFGEKVARLPKDDPGGDPSGESVLYVDVRRFCQQRLAQLPPEARAVYRGRVDAQAERWYRQGEERRDRVRLRRVVDEAFCSSWGDDAVELLGDLAFQEGRFDESLDDYRRLVADEGHAASRFVHPDPSVDLARVAAKKLLCRQALGIEPPGDKELAIFARTYPNASGMLAGRDGLYLTTLAAAFRLDQLAPVVQTDNRWPTFAGASTRTRVVAEPVDVGSLQWRVDLEPVRNVTGPRGYRGVGTYSGPTRPEKLLAYHPIIVGDQVIVGDDTQIVAYNLNDRPEGPVGTPNGAAKIAWRHDEELGGPPQANRQTVGIPRYTLTANSDRIYARMGQTTFPTMGGRVGVGTQTYLVAVDRATDGKLLWKKPPSEISVSRKPGENASRNLGFEGTPVADAHNIYVAMTDRREQTATYVVCLDGETGATRWVRYLGAASSDAENMMGFGMGMGMGMGGLPAPGDYGHRLLTLDGATIYYQTNLGAVAALDAETGSIRWVATYPRQDRSPGGPHDRDLNPAVLHDGLVMVAPDDANAIYAFDAATGRPVWKSEPIPDEVRLAHLLGVAKGRLVATGDRVLLFDVKTGKMLHSWPDSGHGFEGYGRGVLAGDKIYWPTLREIHVLQQEDALRSDPPIRLQETYQETGGNLAIGDGYLIVAQERKLVVFCQNRRLIQRYREEIARAPDQAAPYFRLSQAAEAAGDDTVALESLEATVKRAKSSEMVDGAPLVEAAIDHRYRLLMKLGEKSRPAGNLSAAERHFRDAADSARLERDRLHARLALADVQYDRGAVSDSVKTLQTLLADENLRGLNVTAEAGRRTVRSELLIADRLATIVGAKGRDVYKEFDREASALLDAGRESGDARQLAEIARNYPAAEVVPDALLELGRMRQALGRPVEAARAYKRLLGTTAGDLPRARALIGLARAYEEQKLWVSARDAYATVAARYAAVLVGGEGPDAKTPLGTLASARLSRPPFDRMTGDRSEPWLPAPLGRLWSKPLEASWHPLTADGVPPTSESGRIFLTRGSELRPIDTTAAGPRWTADVGGNPLWVGYLDDRVLVATADRIQALALASGGSVWKFDTTAPTAARRKPSPFDRPATTNVASAVSEPSGKLHGVRIVASRVYCLRGDRQLIGLDGETGQVDWTFTSSAGTINPNVLVTPEFALLQLQKPNAAIVLDATTGRRRAEFALGEDDDWARPPLAIDADHVALVANRRTVALFDLTRGTNSWVFRESGEMPRNGPPRLFGDSERLLLVHDGNELIRLDAATGVKRWSRPLGSENLSERPEAFALDGDQVYWVNRRNLNGAALKDGALAWTRYLSGPESGWSVDLSARCVLAYPGQPQSAGGECEGLPLVFRRRRDGALVQRLLFPAVATDVAVRLAPGGLLVATGNGIWSLGEKSPVDAGGDGR
jgi:cellulose synthase operon protein C